MKNPKLLEWLSILSCLPAHLTGVFGFGASTVKNQENGGVLMKKRGTGVNGIPAVPVPARFLEITTETVQTVDAGKSYQEMVNATLSREGKPADFKAFGTHRIPVPGSDNLLLWQYVKRDPKTGEILPAHLQPVEPQLYLVVYLGYSATMVSELRYLDAFGKEIPAEEYKQVKEDYLKKDSDSSRQGTDKQVVCREYKVENVTYFKRGETWIDTRKKKK